MSKIEVNAIEPQCGTTLTVGASGDTITFPTGTTIVNNGSQTGFGRTGTVDWITTPKTTGTFTAVSGEGYFCNTSGGVITANLPAGVAGAIVSFADYAGTWQTNNVTVSPNGTEKIGGENVSVTLNTEGQSVTLVYVDSTQGWINTMDSTSNVRGNPFIVATGGTITCCGDYKIHTFTGPGTFCVSNVGAGTPTGPSEVDYLVVAGGAGAGINGAGGGGAGGFRLSNSTCMPAPLTSPLANPTGITVTATAFPIAVGGAGGAGSGCAAGSNGGVSTFSTITSAGGGGGGVSNGVDGGSGGGAHRTGSGGSGNTPPVSPSQGNNGNQGNAAAQSNGGGGGGAGAVGIAGGCGTGGGGGIGSFVSPTLAGSNGTTGPVGSTRYFAGGGGGGGGTGTLSAGGFGGGGDGGPNTNDNGEAGETNTGGGGGGGGNAPGGSPGDGGAGGSGIVIIRYKFQ